MAMNCDFCRSIKFRIILASIGVFAGLLAGVWFAVQFHSYNSSSFAFVSTVFASFALLLHVKYKNGTLHRWTPYLRSISIFGCVGQLIGFTAFVTYIVLAIVQRQSFGQVYGENYWVSLVWAWMTWKWGFGLFWYAREYRREFEAESASLKNGGDFKDNGSSNNPATADGEQNE